MNDTLLTLAFLCIAIVGIFIRFIFPIVGIGVSVIWMKKKQDNKKTVPIILIVLFSLWLLYSIWHIYLVNILK